MKASTLVATGAVLFATSALSDTGISEDTFQNDPSNAVLQAAPLWFLPSGTCFPSSAGDPNTGIQTDGNDPDFCNILKLDNNCPSQPTFQSPYTRAQDFPTYYVVRYCERLDQWRVLYDVWFTKDTGHRDDWEWALVNFKRGADGLWYRDSVVLEQDGDQGFSAWSTIPEAFDSDITANDGSAGNHAKLYMSKWHHSIHTTPQSDIFKDTCPSGTTVDFRNDDYYWNSAGWLADANTQVLSSWVWFIPGGFRGGRRKGHVYDFVREDNCGLQQIERPARSVFVRMLRRGVLEDVKT